MAGSQSHMNCHSIIHATVDKFQLYKAMLKERLKTFPFELGVIVLLLLFRSFLFCFFNGANVNDGFSTKASGVFLTRAQEVTRNQEHLEPKAERLKLFRLLYGIGNSCRGKPKLLSFFLLLLL